MNTAIVVHRLSIALLAFTMKTLATLLLLVNSVTAAATLDGSLVATDSSGAAFDTIAQQWLQAYNRKDTAALSSLYAEDAMYVSSHVPGLEAVGRDQVIAYFHAGIVAGGRLDAITVLSTHLSDSLATVFCKYEANNSGVRASGRTMLVLRKINDTWRISMHLTVV